MIISITGPSGVGKTTLLHNLLKALPHTRTLTSVTTREPRPTDEPGEYEYVSLEEYKEMSQRGEFAWEVHPHGRHYATRKKIVDEALASTDTYLPILVIESVKILHQCAARSGKESSLQSLYIWIEDEQELRKRFASRGDMTEQQIESRIEECRSWNQRAKESGVSFIYLDATKTPEDILTHALGVIGSPDSRP